MILYIFAVIIDTVLFLVSFSISGMSDITFSLLTTLIVIALSYPVYIQIKLDKLKEQADETKRMLEMTIGHVKGLIEEVKELSKKDK